MEDAPMAAESSDWKKEREARNAKIKQLFKQNPNNEIIKEMMDEVTEEERRSERKGPSPMQYIHEAVWAAERAYNDGASFSKICDDLCEAIDACCKVVADKPRKTTAKGDDY